MKPYNKQGATKGEEVREMFNKIAPAYDRLNHILSFQIDKIWRARVVGIVKDHCDGALDPKILDLATGTGDLAIAMGEAVGDVEVIGADPSEGMLAVAERKVAERGFAERISLQCQSAEALSFEDESFDVVTAAFGVRNYSDLERGLSEMVRVTRAHGLVVVLEFSTPPNPIFRAFYNLYSRHILPRIGAMLSRDRKAYEYLPASVEEFASPEQFLELIERVGLDKCTAYSQSFGIAQIYVGRKKKY
ncbi:MAG: bifunctional demethylmenaquinone methyltransferase/2-methoxy-6-polyprenyl-1,4-benzoquinol methylase UbiE [Rikenellaceae bacterium]